MQQIPVFPPTTLLWLTAPRDSPPIPTTLGFYDPVSGPRRAERALPVSEEHTMAECRIIRLINRGGGSSRTLKNALGTRPHPLGLRTLVRLDPPLNLVVIPSGRVSSSTRPPPRLSPRPKPYGANKAALAAPQRFPECILKA
jgi:hypothetical protein